MQRFMELQRGFEAEFKRLDQPVAKLNDSYVKALGKLLKKESGAGKLDSSLRVKAEMDGFKDGVGFDRRVFDERTSNDRSLETLRRKYLGERGRINRMAQGAIRELVAKYQRSLKHLEAEQTKLQHLELAQKIRAQRLALAKDSRFIAVASSTDKGEPVSARLHFVVKGEVEFRHNGDRLSFRDTSENPQYVDGVTRPRDFQIGDMVIVKMRSTAVYRNFIMALESRENKVSEPIRQIDYRYIGAGVDDAKLDPAKVKVIENRPENGSGDANMISLWEKHGLSAQGISDSEWIKIGASAEWHVYAIVVTPKMLGAGK